MTIHYPGADMSRYYANRYKGITKMPTKGVLHSTEGGGLPDYQGGKIAPNLTVDVRNRKVYEHFPLDMSARALRRASLAPPTNTAGVVQIEIIGSCDPKSKIQPKMYELTPDELAFLASVMHTVSTLTKIPLDATDKPWLRYDASYGSRNGQRMSWLEWAKFAGWCGHTHVPGNDHGDPGDIAIAELIRMAREADIVVKTTASAATSAATAGKVTPPPPRQPVTALPFPLPLGHYFSRESKSIYAHSGYYARDRNWIMLIQEKVGVTRDGYFGPATEAAVRRSQATHGVAVDGKVGAVTWAAFKVR